VSFDHLLEWDAAKIIQYFCLAQAVYPTLFALYPTYEKTRNVRAIQYSNGIRALPLWTAYALFDFMFVFIISVVCTAIIAFQARHWFAVSYMFPVLALYGLSSTLMAYCFSLIARSQLAAFAWAAGVQCIMFILSIMAFVVRIHPYSKPQVNIL
jgi:ATP-binding cassette subfamily A (ABC1) protein 3